MVTKKKLTKAEWQDLAKKLQVALENQIDENERLDKELSAMTSRAYKITEALFKTQGVVEYLEKQGE